MGADEAATAVSISVDALRRELEWDHAPTVLDVRWKLGSTPAACHSAYLGGHIPGAVFVDLEGTLADPDAGNGRHPLPCPDAFEKSARDLGVHNDRPVVVYDDCSGLAASRLWWLLTDAGHGDVRVLDGGLGAWRAAGGALETGAVAPVEGRFMAETGNLDVVDADDVADAAGDGDVTIWDVRAPERYRGETEPIDHVAGHIPGAKNLPAGSLLVDGRLRPLAELEQIFSVVEPGDIISCGSGITACQVIWALHAIGRTDVALYAGSWSDWISDPRRPVEAPVER